MALPGGKAMGLSLLPPPSVQLCCLCPPSPRSNPSRTKCLQPTKEAAHLTPDRHNPHPAAKAGDRHCPLPLLTPHVPPPSSTWTCQPNSAGCHCIHKPMDVVTDFTPGSSDKPLDLTQTYQRGFNPAYLARYCPLTSVHCLCFGLKLGWKLARARFAQLVLYLVQLLEIIFASYKTAVD